MKMLGTLPQDKLVVALREAVDAVRIADPLNGPSPAARRRLRKLIRENGSAIQTIHVQHNIGRTRAEWLAPLIESELRG